MQAADNKKRKRSDAADKAPPQRQVRFEVDDRQAKRKSLVPEGFAPIRQPCVVDPADIASGRKELWLIQLPHSKAIQSLLSAGQLEFDPTAGPGSVVASFQDEQGGSYRLLQDAGCVAHQMVAVCPSGDPTGLAMPATVSRRLTLAREGPQALPGSTAGEPEDEAAAISRFEAALARIEASRQEAARVAAAEGGPTRAGAETAAAAAAGAAAGAETPAAGAAGPSGARGTDKRREKDKGKDKDKEKEKKKERKSSAAAPTPHQGAAAPAAAAAAAAAPAAHTPAPAVVPATVPAGATPAPAATPAAPPAPAPTGAETARKHKDKSEKNDKKKDKSEKKDKKEKKKDKKDKKSEKKEKRSEKKDKKSDKDKKEKKDQSSSSGSDSD